jgi:hypothetical protein
LPSISRGHVQPFGVRSTIIGQIGRFTTPRSRASAWICRISATIWSSVAAIAWCIAIGSWPSTK